MLVKVNKIDAALPTSFPSEIDDYKFSEERIYFSGLNKQQFNNNDKLDEEFEIIFQNRLKNILHDCKFLNLDFYGQESSYWSKIKTYDLHQTNNGDFILNNSSISLTVEGVENILTGSSINNLSEKRYLILIRCENK